MKRAICLMLTVICAVIPLISGCGPTKEGDAMEAAAGWDSVVVAVNGDNRLLLSDFMYFMRTSQAEIEQQLILGGQYTEDTVKGFWTQEQAGMTMESMLKQQALVDGAHFRNLLKLANDAGTQVDEETAGSADAAIDEEVNAMDADPGEAARLFLEAYGVTPDQMKRIYADMDIINQYLVDISISTGFSEEELRSEYDADPGAFDQVTVRHVLVLCDDNMTEEKQRAAKEKAEEILAMAAGGEDMGSLAAEYSEDEGSKDNNGEYTFGRGRMVEEFEEWAFSAGEGDMGIVKTTYGYHVVLLVKRYGYEELKDSIGYQLGDELAERVINDSLLSAESDWIPEEGVLDNIRV